MKRLFSQSSYKHELEKLPPLVPDFIKVKTNDGLKLKTVWFPAKFDKPHSTIFYIHSYGSYLEKYAPVM